MDRQTAEEHPPRDHMLRDLNLTLEYNGNESSTARIPVAPSVCSNRGAVQAGVLATLVDIASGALAARSVFPDFAVTGDLRMYTAGHAKTGEVMAVASVLRAGRAAIVVKAEIRAGTAEDSISIGSGMGTFYRLSRRDGNMEMVKDVVSNQVTTFHTNGPGLSGPFLDKAGLRVVDEAAGVVELEVSRYVQNYFGALEGGMIAVLADVAGQGAACSAAGRPMITADLAMSYLSQGKMGPIYTRTEVLRTTVDSVLTRISIFDRGAGDTLMSMAMNTAVVV